MVGNSEFGNTVITHLKSRFQVGSEDRNDVTFAGQRIHWKGKPRSPGSYIKVDQKLAIGELREVNFEKCLTDNIVCTANLHTEYRSVLGLAPVTHTISLMLQILTMCFTTGGTHNWGYAGLKQACPDGQDPSCVSCYSSLKGAMLYSRIP